MNTIKLQGTRRSDFGAATTRQIRSEGNVPGVIYGGEESIHFTTKKLGLRALVYTPQFQIAEIEIDGKSYRCILKDMQFDVVNDELIHVDFLELVDGKRIIAELPLKFNGQPQGVKDGGRLVIKIKSVKVRTYPRFLRENLEVDIKDLKLMGNIRIQDIVAENIEIMNPPRIPIASVVLTRALKQEADGTGGAAATEDAAAEDATAEG